MIDLRDEEWRSVSRHSLYEVSNLGNVRSWARRGQLGVRAKRARAVYGEVTRDGYRRVHLGKHARAMVHQLVAEAFLGPRGEATCCRHLNGNPLDNRVLNLAWGSFADNEADKRAHGRALLGERHHQARITAADALVIRESAEPGVILARRFNVSPSAVSLIRKGKIWRTAA